MNKPWQKRMRLRRNRTIRAMQRKRTLAQAKKDRWLPPLYEDKDNGHLKPIQVGNKYWKAQSNRHVRRSKEIPLHGNGYRKVFDYRWQIY